MSKTSPKAISERMDEIKKELALKAAQNSAFRADLKSNPIATIEKEYSLPPGSLGKIKIQVVEEAADTIVVPIPQSLENAELTDEQLEAVAGGAAFVAGAITVAVLGAAAGAAAVVLPQQEVTRRAGW